MELFNLVIRYEVEAEIPVVDLSDPYWIKEVDKIINSNSTEGIVEFNDKVLSLIASKLNFGRDQKTKNPNKFRASTAHCIGYAALNASILRKYYGGKEYQISHVRGKVYFLGIELTKRPKSSFFKDHDFVRIKNKSTGKEYYSDGSIYEFIRVKRVGLKGGI